jgi:hypothetical protein
MVFLRRGWSRVRARYGTVSVLISYAVLASIWAEQFVQTSRNLLPRFDPALSKALGTSGAPRACPECDFSAFWPAARLARVGDFAAIYDPARFEAYRQTVFFARVGGLNWFYPPPSLLVVVPFGLLPFGLAFYAWVTILTGLAAWLLRLVRLPRLVIAAALLSPAFLWNLELGQFGAVTGAAIVFSLLAVKAAPRRAGLVLGLLVIKPQAGLLVPVAFLAGRHLRAVAAAVAAVVAVLILTTACFGWAVWHAYLTTGLAVSRAVINAPPSRAGYEHFGVSVFWMLRSFGADVAAANVSQAVTAIVAAGLAIMVWRRCGANDPYDRMAQIVFLSLLATPYGYVDDMGAFSIAITIMAWRRHWRIDLLDVVFWTWPTLCPLIYKWTDVEMTPLVVAVAAAKHYVGAYGIRSPVAARVDE